MSLDGHNSLPVASVQPFINRVRHLTSTILNQSRVYICKEKVRHTNAILCGILNYSSEHYSLNVFKTSVNL